MEIDPSSDVRDYYVLCSQCGNFAHLSENQIYCIICGEKMQIACPGCSKPILYPTARYCASCGTQLTRVRLDGDLDVDQVQEKKSTKSPDVELERR